MNKIKSLDDLRKMKQGLEAGMSIREKSDRSEAVTQIRVGMATCGIAAGAREVMNRLLQRVEKEEISAIVTQGGCLGYCYAEPTVEVTVPGKDPVVFSMVDEKVADQIIDRYILNGELIDGVIPVNYQSINQ